MHPFLQVAGLTLLLMGPTSPTQPKPTPLDQWLDALASAESGNRAWVVVRDEDGGYNYGCLQFREKTFRAYVRRYNLAPGLNQDEVMGLAYNCSFQKQLAARMIRENPNNWKHWKKSVLEKVGLPPLMKGTAARTPPDLR